MSKPLSQISITKWLSFSALVSVLFFSRIALAQPGWQDYTIRYSYSILNEKGKEISFRKNRRYQIMVDTILFDRSNFPTDSLKPVTQYTYDRKRGYDFQIRINDFSLALPQKDFGGRTKKLEIKIIRQKDTMFFCQATGVGSINPSSRYGKQMNRTKQTDLTLSFTAGHYYFPRWGIPQINQLPLTTGKVKMVNVNQGNFIVPRAVYNEVLNMFNEKRAKTQAEEYVVNNYARGHYFVEKDVRPTTFNKIADPYMNPRWDSPLYPCSDNNLNYGLIEYVMRGNKCSSYKSVFSILNKRKNTIEQWFPKDNLRLFGSSQLYRDTFNDVLYLPVRMKERVSVMHTDCSDRNPAVTKVYRSEDQGKTWVNDERLFPLFNGHLIRYFECIDATHAVAYRREKISLKDKRYKVSQGTYYLLKNRVVVDSFKSPENLHYNDNYNNYKFTRQKDSVALGPWSYTKFRSDSTPYFQPYLKKHGNTWSFKVAKKTFIRRPFERKEAKKGSQEYKNFTLVDYRKLVFRNGVGSLSLDQDVTEQLSYNGYVIFEKNDHIYLINQSHVYFSFDEGASWYVYPLPIIYGNYRHQFLEMNKADQISYFGNSRTEGMNKVLYTFSLEQ